MNIKFQTNLDRYNGTNFPTNLEHVPRIGESVQVVTESLAHFRSKKLPTALEVVDVIHTADAVICELWYKKTSLAIANAAGINLF